MSLFNETPNHPSQTLITDDILCNGTIFIGGDTLSANSGETTLNQSFQNGMEFSMSSILIPDSDHLEEIISNAINRNEK